MRADNPTPASIAYIAEFQTLIWSFISAMRAGVLESQHAGVLLKEYGRLDKAFDASLHVVAEILQDEGIYNHDGEMVSKVIGQALQEVSICGKYHRSGVFADLEQSVIRLPPRCRYRTRSHHHTWSRQTC